MEQQEKYTTFERIFEELRGEDPEKIIFFEDNFKRNGQEEKLKVGISERADMFIKRWIRIHEAERLGKLEDLDLFFRLLRWEPLIKMEGMLQKERNN